MVITGDHEVNAAGVFEDEIGPSALRFENSSTEIVVIDVEDRARDFGFQLERIDNCACISEADFI